MENYRLVRTKQWQLLALKLGAETRNFQSNTKQITKAQSTQHLSERFLTPKRFLTPGKQPLPGDRLVAAHFPKPWCSLSPGPLLYRGLILSDSSSENQGQTGHISLQTFVFSTISCNVCDFTDNLRVQHILLTTSSHSLSSSSPDSGNTTDSLKHPRCIKRTTNTFQHLTADSFTHRK